jgi:hypothetical protein
LINPLLQQTAVIPELRATIALLETASKNASLVIADYEIGKSADSRLPRVAGRGSD